MNNNRDILERVIDRIQMAELINRNADIDYPLLRGEYGEGVVHGLKRAARIVATIREEVYDANKEV